MPKRTSVAAGLGLVTLLAFLGARTARRRLAAVTVAGRSMEPTLCDQDRLLAWRVPRPLRVGDVVVLESPYDAGVVVQEGVTVPWQRPPAGPGETDRRWIVKRIVALPGDSVPKVAVGKLLEGDTVPAGRLLVVGDNPDESYDSRQIGYIPVERVFGLVLRRLSTGART
ncbi:MAG TPA: S26 family signal peptidase [Kribbella sp.]|uniref:S26 family signal peptidase n=1 Tax=Kribbella sp. TaxID=1871183 RepID=UPI002D77B691|nr:S26 family signal peptidase [Kribbella sp.]HET6296626.1 S26 family signal peptidase [Kribbella sp.]